MLFWIEDIYNSKTFLVLLIFFIFWKLQTIFYFFFLQFLISISRKINIHLFIFILIINANISVCQFFLFHFSLRYSEIFIFIQKNLG